MKPEVDVPVVVTMHPSAVLRAGERRHELRAELVEDLTLVRDHLGDRSRATVARRVGVFRLTPTGIAVVGRQRPEKRRRTMPPRGIEKGSKRARQYEHIKDSLLDDGRSEGTAEEIAARTVNKERARSGESETSSRLSREDLSSGRRGGIRSHRKSPRGRTRDQLYEEAKDKNVKGRSKMTKAQLARAVGGR